VKLLNERRIQVVVYFWHFVLAAERFYLPLMAICASSQLAEMISTLAATTTAAQIHSRETDSSPFCK